MLLVAARSGIHHKKANAEPLIVEVAVDCAEHIETVVIADDTDILVLLIHHAGHAKYNVLFKSNIKRESKKLQRCGTYQQQNTTWGVLTAPASFFIMPYLDVTPHPNCMESACGCTKRYP